MNDSTSRSPPEGQIRVIFNMPVSLRRKLRMEAAKRGVTMSALVIAALKKEGVK